RRRWRQPWSATAPPSVPSSAASAARSSKPAAKDNRARPAPPAPMAARPLPACLPAGGRSSPRARRKPVPLFPLHYHSYWVALFLETIDCQSGGHLKHCFGTALQGAPAGTVGHKKNVFRAQRGVGHLAGQKLFQVDRNLPVPAGGFGIAVDDDRFVAHRAGFEVLREGQRLQHTDALLSCAQG